MSAEAKAKFDDDLRGAVSVLRSLLMDAGEFGPDLLSIRVLGMRLAERLQALRRPTHGHRVAAHGLRLATDILASIPTAASFEAALGRGAPAGSDVAHRLEARTKIYKAYYLFGHAVAFATAAAINQEQASKRITAGAVTQLLKDLIAEFPDAGGTELTRRLSTRPPGFAVSPQYANRLRGGKKPPG